MSLLSQWNVEADLIEQAYLKSNIQPSGSSSGGSSGGSSTETDPDVLETLFQNKNQWRCLKYNYSNRGITPSYSYLTTVTESDGVQYRSHDTSDNWAWGDHYLGVRECYVYCTQNYTLSTSFFTDDDGRIYLNGSSITTSTSCQTKSVSLPFKKGLNHVEILFYEWEGGDAGYLNTNLASQSWVKWMYACYKS